MGAGPARAGTSAEEFGVTGVVPALPTILVDPEVDAVDLCVPNHLP
jgi:predicted dehydrogenase